MKQTKKATRDSKGRYFSYKLLIRTILLTLLAIGIVWGICEWDKKYNPVELINPLVSDSLGAEKTMAEIIRDREDRSVTSIIAEVFGEYADQAVKVAFCESRLNREAISHTGDYGVFQLNKATWFHHYSLDNESALFATENVAVAWDIFKKNGYSWRAWYSSYKCHGLR